MEFGLDEFYAVVDQCRSSMAKSDELLISAETTALLGRLIAGLPPELRDAITLTAVQDLSASEVATILGIGEATVRSRVFRARQILKDKLSVLLGRQHGSKQS